MGWCRYLLRSCKYLDLVQNNTLIGKNKGKVNNATNSPENIRRDPEILNKYVCPESKHEQCIKSMDLHK